MLIDVSSKSKIYGKLSPSRLGPFLVYSDVTAPSLIRAWQASMVHPEHLGVLGLPTDEWLRWSRDGMDNKKDWKPPNSAPLFFYMNGQKYSLEEGKRKWYNEVYQRLAHRTAAWAELVHQWFLHYKDVELDDNGEGHGKFLMEMLRAQ